MGDARAFAVILDSTRGTRHLDSTRSSPASLETLESQRTVLDWTLSALSSCGIEDVTYVGGYHIQKVIERYPGLGYRYQSGWARQGEVAALELARPTHAGRCLIIRSDVICVPDALRKLIAGKHGVAAGYYEDGPAQSFVGLIALPLLTTYSATKFALNALTDGLRAEVADDGIDVISVCPGRVKTSFQENVLQNVIREDRSGGISAERVAEAILKASRRRKRLVVVPAYLKWGIAVANALPALKEWGRRQMWRRAAKKDA